MLHNIVQGLANAQIANILTIVFVALIFISVMWGLFRGFKKSIFYSIFYVIACAILFLSLDKIASLALSFDISWLGYSINGVKLVTLGDSVPEILRSILSQGNGADLSTMFVKGTESYTLVNTVLGSIVQFAVVLAFVLLFQTVYKLLIWLLWLIIGKPFDRRRVRVRGKTVRKPKNGTGGALVGFIPGLISVVMLFVPLSGVFSIAQSMTRVEVKNGVSFGDYLDESDYHLLQQVLGQYEESVPGKLFNIKTSEDGRSLDLWLLDKCITVEVDGNKFNIREDIENMGEFASNMAATGLLDVMLDGESSTHDLVNVVNDNEDKIVKAFSSLGDIELIDLLLNTGIEYLDCSRIIDNSLELSSDSINYENLAKLDWSKELAQIGNIFISAVDILSLVPDSSLTSPTIELDKVDLDKLNNDDILETFVNELFESNIINEGATAGLAYVLGIDNVKEIVGEFDKDELKNVDLKADLLRVVEATKSILNIGMDNLKNIDLKELSNKSQELKVIVDELLSMEIFTLVEENVIDYAITNYVENNENIKKFVDVEELRELRLVDFKRELGYVIDTFGRLGSETKLFELDGAENILMDKLNMDAFNSNALRIIVDNVDKSTTIQDFMDDILRGALVPSIFTEEKYNDLLTKENFEWSDELYVLVDLLKAIETNNSDFNIYVMATSDEKEITVGMLKGLYGVDENNEYIIDKSIFVEEMMLSVINKATEGNDFEGAFDDVDSLGVELEALTEMMIDAGIVEDRNDYVVDFNNISNEFDGVNLKMLRSISTHIGESNILRSIIDTKITDFKVNDKEVIDTTDWDANKYTEEFTVLYEVLEASGKIDEEEKTPFNELGNLFSDSIPLTMLEEVSKEVGHSEILQSTMKIALEEQFENTDFDSWTNEDWTNETTSLYNIINDGELYTIDSEGDKVINLDEFTNLDEIKLVTIEAFKDNVKDSTLIQDLMSEELTVIMGDDYDFDAWDGNKWEVEMTALYNVSETMSKENTEGEDVISFDDFEDMSEIKMTTIAACRDNIENSEMIQDLMSEELTVIMGDDYDFDAWNGNKWEVEMTALYNVSGTISKENTEGEDVISFDDFEDMSEIKLITIAACRDNIENSEMIQDLMKDNLGSIMGDDYDYSSWDGSKWEVEMTSLYEISDTIKTKNTNNEDVIDLSSDLVGSEVKLVTIEAVSNNSHSDIIRNCMQDTINDLLVIENAPTLTCNPTSTYSGWDDAQWAYELYVLDVVSTELSTDGETINTSTMADSLNTIEVPFFNELANLIYGNNNGGSNKYNSYILQAQLTSAVESIMNTGFNSSDARYRFLHPSNVNPEVNYLNNVPEYSDYSIAEDSDVGIWWSNELHSLYNLLVAMYGETGTITALDNIELNSVTIATLNAIRDNIHTSYVLQSSMRATIEDVMNGDLNNGTVSVTEMITEFYSGETWKQEIAAIRNVAKTVSTYTGGGTLSYSYSLNSLNNFKYDGSNDGIMNENLDKYYEIDLNSIDLGDELKVETLYYATFYADRSNVIRSLLRVSIAEILGENDDDFVEYWLNKDSGIYDSFYNNRWTYEMEALFNVSSKLAKDGKIDLSGSMLNKIPVSLFDEINGAFTVDNIIDGSNIISGLKDHGYISNYQTALTEYEFASEIIRSLLKDSLASTDGVINPSVWSDEQWAYEINAISKVSSLLAVNDELDISTISFDGGIKAELLVVIPKIIDKATFLQHKLKPELENLVDSSMFTRPTIIADYGSSFELDVNYGDSDYAWRVELATVFGIITYDDGTLSSGLVDSNGIVAIIDVQEKLEQLNIDIIQIAAMLLKEKANTLYTYNTSRIVRLNLIAPLEEMSACTNVTYSGITQSDLPFITNPNAFPPFEWINDGTHTTDLEELYDFFDLLGATNVTEATYELENITMADHRYLQIISLAENSFFLTVVVYNQILNP